MSLSSRSSSSGRSSGGGPEQSGGYFAYRHPAQGEGENDPLNYIPITMDDQSRGDGRRMGSVSVQNGGINLHIPCAFSYAYDIPVPPQPELQGKSQPTSRTRSVAQNKSHPSRVPKSRSVPTKLSQPFCTTVKSGELYKARDLPSSSSSCRTQNKCSVIWDFKPGQSVPFQSVGYGQELYEEAAQNLARTLQAQMLEERKSSTLSEVEDNCFDFSKPGINSSKTTAKALERAIDNLKNLPEEVESMLRQDKRFVPVVLGKATRTLNVSRNSKVFKDLIPVDPNPDVRTETENMIQAEIKRSIEAARQPSRSKDSEPKLEDFQSNSYTRIRPSPVQTPPKPTSGISIVENHDFDTIELERRLEDESHRFDS